MTDKKIISLVFVSFVLSLVILFSPSEVFSLTDPGIGYYKQLDWSDFQGTPGVFINDEGKDTWVAYTVSAINANWKFKKLNTSFCQYEYTSFNAYGNFKPLKSWVKESSKNGPNSEHLLNHEQGHLDITEIYGRALETYALNNYFNCPNGVYDAEKINEKTRDLLDQFSAERSELDDLYDLETSHSKDRQKQVSWNLKIDCMLQNNGPSDYCQSLTRSFDTFTSYDYDFSIDYPDTWFVNDEPYEEDGWVGIVSFSPNQQGDPFFGVSIESNAERIFGAQGNQYLEQLVNDEVESCESMTFQESGSSCYIDELIESDYFVEGNDYAYAVAFAYSLTYPNGNIEERIFLETEIPSQGQALQLVFDSSLGDWDLYSNSYDEMIGTYEVLTYEEPVYEEPVYEDSEGGGCLIATAAYGTELAPQVQFLREIRDNTVMSTASGTSFMTGFNQLYYSFSPTIADLERENPIFQEAVRAFITPMISTLSIMTLADSGSESEVLGFGISVIMLNLGMYIVAPALVGVAVSKRLKK